MSKFSNIPDHLQVVWGMDTEQGSVPNYNETLQKSTSPVERDFYKNNFSSDQVVWGAGQSNHDISMDKYSSSNSSSNQNKNVPLPKCQNNTSNVESSSLNPENLSKKDDAYLGKESIKIQQFAEKVQHHFSKIFDLVKKLNPKDCPDKKEINLMTATFEVTPSEDETTANEEVNLQKAGRDAGDRHSGRSRSGRSRSRSSSRDTGRGGSSLGSKIISGGKRIYNEGMNLYNKVDRMRTVGGGHFSVESSKDKGIGIKFQMGLPPGKVPPTSGHVGYK